MDLLCKLKSWVTSFLIAYLRSNSSSSTFPIMLQASPWRRTSLACLSEQELVSWPSQGLSPSLHIWCLKTTSLTPNLWIPEVQTEWLLIYVLKSYAYIYTQHSQKPKQVLHILMNSTGIPSTALSTSLNPPPLSDKHDVCVTSTTLSIVLSHLSYVLRLPLTHANP